MAQHGEAGKHVQRPMLRGDMVCSDLCSHVFAASYMLYTMAWQVPEPVLPAPMALIWLNMAKLVSIMLHDDH
jgi:hypothetical protein